MSPLRTICLDILIHPGILRQRRMERIGYGRLGNKKEGLGMIYQQRFLFLFQQQQTSAQMQTESQLYAQSQEEITPIIDYIPLLDTLPLPESSRWRMKEQLDESRERTQTFHPSQQSMQPFSSLRIQSRLNTESAANDYDKKTTSIMQGHSANTIPSNELSINIIKDNLKSCMTYYQKNAERNHQSHLQPNQNSSRNTQGQRWRAKSRETEASLHFMNQRSKLLRNIDRSLEEDRTPEKERFEFQECRRERKKLLNEILVKLESTVKQKKQVELVKSNFKETDISISDKKEENSKQKSIDYSKKSKVKKWVETKNALKSAAEDSTQKCLSNSKVLQEHQILRNTVSQWKSISPQLEFESPTIMTHPGINLQFIPIPSSNSGFFTAHKDFPSRREQEIFTFSNIQGIPFQRHIKNVSISVSESSSKEFITSSQTDPLVTDCLLCKVIGKRCSFH